jgi:drug/metabolite transporter (DMT)-like permease
VVEPVFPRLEEARRARPAVGYAMASAAALLWAVNGIVSKVILATGLSSLRLAEVRSSGAVVLLGAVLAFARPRSLKLRREELPFLAFFGICGLALVQWFYFLAIHRLQIGIALLIQYLAPVLVALWARFGAHEPVRKRLWAALALALAGLTLVLDVWRGIDLNTIGVVASLLAAVAFALYILLAEHAVGNREPVSLVCYGFFFAALFWACVQPWWTFPRGIVGDRVSLLGNLASSHLPVWALMAWMIVLGTIVPFGLLVGSLRHIPARVAGIVAMLEPVAATGVAYAWLGESLGAAQLAGGAVVLVGIGLAQSAR